MAKKKQKTTQTVIFDMTPTEEELKHAVVLKQPDPVLLMRKTSDLQYKYSKDELYEQGRTFYPMLKDKVVVKEMPDGSRPLCHEIEPLFSMASLKNQLAQALAFILSEPDNLKPYIASLSDEMRHLWQELLIHFYVSHEKAQAILGTTDELYATSYYYYTPKGWNKPGFDFFKLTSSLQPDASQYGWREYAYYITINADTHALFFPLLFPGVHQADPTVAELPDNSYQTFSLEGESHAMYTLLTSLIKTGKVAMLQKGISQADIKRVAKSLGLTEFFSDGPTPQPTLRSRYYIEMLALEEIKYNNKKNARPYHETLRSMINHLDNLKTYLPSLLLPHIKGLRKQMMENCALTDLCEALLLWLKEEPDRWTALEGFILKLYALNAGTDPLRDDMTVFYPGDQSERTEIINEYTGQKIACDSFVSEFGCPALQGFAFMLTSLGIAELALAPESQSQRHSPFDRAAYIRLTPLGRYALGLDNDYEAPKSDHVAYFELDPDRLIIRSLANPNPYAQLLLDTSVAISRNRYETSARSFLAHCQSRSDVEEKIGIFKQFVSSELPPLWKQFFDSLLQHCNPLTSNRTGYKIYQLSPSNTDLVRLLTTDPRLRTLVVRAEGYLLLVKKDDLKRFTEELKKHGYLL